MTMDLATKGAEAPMGTFHRLTTKMRWTGAVDLDLAVFSVKKGNTIVETESRAIPSIKS